MSSPSGVSKLAGRLALSLGSVIVTLALVEIGLRAFVHVAKLPDRYFDPEVGRHYVPEQTGRWVVGEANQIDAIYRINNMGWNSSRDYVSEKPADVLRIAVIGDSFVEALQVEPDEAFHALAEHTLAATPECRTFRQVEVYSFGFSGAPLSQYLSMMRYAAKNFDPDAFVILIVSNDFDESIINANPEFLSFRQGASGEFEEVPPRAFHQPSIRTALTELAITRYLYINLNVPRYIPALRDVFRPQPGAGSESADDNPEMLAGLTAHIFARYKQVAGETGAPLLLMMDADRGVITSGRQASPEFIAYQNYATSASATLGIDFADLTGPFTDDFSQNGLPFNTTVDAHWNERGHQVAANVMSQWAIQHLCPSDSP